MNEIVRCHISRTGGSILPDQLGSRVRVEGLASSWSGAVARYRKGLKREFLRTRLGVQSRAARKLDCKKEFWQCRNKTELSCAGSLKTTGTGGTRRWPESCSLLTVRFILRTETYREWKAWRRFITPMKPRSRISV